jgi:hypothetical protein
MESTAITTRELKAGGKTAFMLSVLLSAVAEGEKSDRQSLALSRREGRPAALQKIANHDTAGIVPRLHGPANKPPCGETAGYCPGEPQGRQHWPAARPQGIE